MKGNDLFRNILRGGYFHTNSVTLNAHFLKKMQPFNQYCWPHEDVEMWLRVAYYGRIVGPENEEPVASYRLHGSNNINNANRGSSMKLWSTVFNYWFYRNIGMKNRLIILKQLFRYKFLA